MDRPKTFLTQIRSLKLLLQYGGIIFCLIVGFAFVTAPLFHDGFFPTMDDVQVVRIDEMARELASGQFPVRLVSELGNGGGYLLFHFYAPFVYYVGAVYHFIGFSLVQSTKLVFVTGYLVALVGMVVLLKRYSDWLTTTIGTLLFLAAVYVGYDVYTRGALAEFFGLAWLPWLFATFLKLKERRSMTAVVGAGVVYGLLIVTHNITSFTATLFLLALQVIPPHDKNSFRQFLGSVLIGSGLAAFFWLPVLLEQHNTVLGTTDFVTKQYLSNFLSPLQIAGIQPIPWGFKPPLLGTSLAIGSLLALAYLLWLRFGRQRRLRVHHWFGSIGLVVAVFLVWEVSKPVWLLIPFMSYMQFPWRYITIATVLAVFVIALGLSQVRRGWLRVVIGVALIVPAVTWHYSYLRPTTYNYIANYHAEDSCRSTSWAQEQLPIWVKECLPKNHTLPLVRVGSRPGPLTVRNVMSAENGRRITFQASGSGQIVLTKYYYPAWNVFSGRQRLQTTMTDRHGLLTFELPEGEHQVTATFAQLPAWRVGNAISLVTFLGAVCFGGLALVRKFRVIITLL